MMFKEINYTCPNCGTYLLHTEECKSVVVKCYKCGISHKINATAQEIIVKMRPPDMQSRPKT